MSKKLEHVTAKMKDKSLPVSKRVKYAKERLKIMGRECRGVDYLSQRHDEVEHFKKRDRQMSIMLGNVDQQGSPENFCVFTSMADTATIRQEVWMPHFYLV